MPRNRFPNPDSDELPWERIDRITREQDAEEEKAEYFYQLTRDREIEEQEEEEK